MRLAVFVTAAGLALGVSKRKTQKTKLPRLSLLLLFHFGVYHEMQLVILQCIVFVH